MFSDLLGNKKNPLNRWQSEKAFANLVALKKIKNITLVQPHSECIWRKYILHVQASQLQQE